MVTCEFCIFIPLMKFLRASTGRLSACCIAILWTAALLPASGQNDSVVMVNRDLLVGEIKGMDRGVMQLKTGYSEKNFQIDWDDVVSVRSHRRFLISLSHGRMLNGHVMSDRDDSARVVIFDKSGQVITTLKEIVFVKPVKKRFLGRFGGKIAAGATLTKANNSLQISINANVDYTSNALISTAFFNYISNFQKNDSVEIKTSRMEGGLAANIFLYKGWVAMLGIDLLQNAEQEIRLRANTKLGIGNFVARNSKLYLLLGGGGAWNHEIYSDTSHTLRNNLEAFSTLEFNIYNIGDLHFLTTVSGYAGLTDWGRWRCDYSMDLKYDLPLDFFINLGFVLNYDNRPVSGASDIDYVLQTTVGWEL